MLFSILNCDQYLKCQVPWVWEPGAGTFAHCKRLYAAFEQLSAATLDGTHTAPPPKADRLVQCTFLGLGCKRKCTKPVSFGGRSAPRTLPRTYLDPRREDTTKTCNRKSLIILILFRVQFQSLKVSSVPKSQKEQTPSL